MGLSFKRKKKMATTSLMDLALDHIIMNSLRSRMISTVSTPPTQTREVLYVKDLVPIMLKAEGKGEVVRLVMEDLTKQPKPMPLPLSAGWSQLTVPWTAGQLGGLAASGQMAGSIMFASNSNGNII